MNLRQKLFYILIYNKNIEFSHVSRRNVTAANQPPPPPNVQLTFLVGKIDM